MSQINHYRAVLDDLQAQRAMHQLKISEIDSAMASLGRLIPADAKEELPTTISDVQSTMKVPQGKYAGISVRWAILSLLNEDATRPLGTGEVAEALQEGGITSSGKNFPANVSAVLSNMNKVRGEVQNNAGEGWIITPSGRQAWAAIRALRARQGSMLSSSVQ